jgi:hypothetical protein
MAVHDIASVVDVKPQNSVHWLNERTIATNAMALGLAASMTSVGAHRRQSGDMNE